MGNGPRPASRVNFVSLPARLDLSFPQSGFAMRATEVLETCIYTDDLDAAERFYREVLGLTLHAKEAGRHVFFRCGDRMFLVFNPKKTLSAGTPMPPDNVPLPLHGTQGAGHAAFAARERDLESWRAHLKKHGVAIEVEVEWPQGGRSIYFRDPAGNSIELATPRLWGLDEAPGATREAKIARTRRDNV